jgi:Protein of unknown function (DUF3551)
MQCGGAKPRCGHAENYAPAARIMHTLAAFISQQRVPGSLAMKYRSFVFGFVIAAAVVATPARAQNYPWCEYLGGGMMGGGKNCGFISFEQCMESARGNGNDCRPNTMYTPPPGPHHGESAYIYGVPHHHHVHKKSHSNS